MESRGTLVLQRKTPPVVVLTGFKWALPDLNRKPAGYESAALTD